MNDRDFLHDNEPPAHAGRWTPLEEHWRIRERVTVLESDIKIQLSNIHMKLDNMASRAAQTTPPTLQPTAMDNLALAIQHAMDNRRQSGGGNNTGMAIGLGAMAPVLVYLVYQFVMK